MILITGQKPYGKCDVVPEVFYVATWFFHFDYIPLIPLRTRLVLGQTGESYHVVDLPFSFKSLFYAWSRAGLLLGGIIAWIAAIIAISDHLDGRNSDFAMTLLIAISCTMGLLFVMIYPRRRLPSYARACQLATRAGLSDRGWAALNVQYGRDITDRPGQTETFPIR